MTTTLELELVRRRGELDFPSYVAERRPALLRVACAIAGDPHSAEDLLQSVLINVGARWDTIREPRAADTYVRRAMANQYASWHRQSWRSREWVTADPPEPPVQWGGWANGPDHEHELRPLVESLPPRQRSAVVLRYYEGLTEAETARVMRCSLGTVKSNTSRGLSTLRRLAIERGYSISPG
ncbi:MAG: SigE family RNA polymerase sigma factor [Nocardioides sp.]